MFSIAPCHSFPMTLSDSGGSIQHQECFSEQYYLENVASCIAR